MQKTCPRCHSRFECNVEAVHRCQCATVQLGDAERNYIREKFDDCLCATCMNELKEEPARK